MTLRNWFIHTFTFIFGFASLFSVYTFIEQTISEPNLVVEANSNCTNATATTPTWNPFPLNRNDPNPQPNGTCTDIPIMSFFPIQTGAGNPRELSFVENQEVTVHLYYNNGARESAANNIMSNPRARIELTRVNNTQYRVRGYLSGSGGTANSSQTQYGGDLIVNVPANTELINIRRNTEWYPQAPYRLRETQNGNITPRSLIIDNDTSVVNPVLSDNGFGLYTPTDTNITAQSNAGLRAGFDESGYILLSWSVTPTQAPTNNPPQVPGQEITIVRGDSGAFQQIVGTDPDGDLPLTYQPNQLPSFCTYNAGTLIITCQTNAQTPERSTFTVTPTDSRGLVGTPGTFIVNVIDPGLTIDKSCVELGTSTPCSNAQLEPGDDVTYTITVGNSGDAPARNVIVLDDYPQTLLTDVRNLNPSNGTNNTTDGTLRWELGTINSGETRTVTYDASVNESANEGSIIENLATASADNVPSVTDETSFTVGVNLPILSQSDKVCFERGTNTECRNANLSIGDEVTYFINVRNTGNATAQNVVVTDTYDNTKLTGITNIQPDGTLNAGSGTITWELGNIDAGVIRTLTFNATISTAVVNGDVIVNTARITADNLPPTTVTVDFPVGVPTTPPQVPRSGGTALALTLLGLLSVGAGVYYYQKVKNKTAPGFEPARSTEAKDVIQKKTSKK